MHKMQLKTTRKVSMVAALEANATHLQIDRAQRENPMNDGPARDRPAPDRTDGLARAPRPNPISSQQLMGGQREIIIQHGAEQYRLRLTNSNKLILVK
jgi:hemin uptake protein HemP